MSDSSRLLHVTMTSIISLACALLSLVLLGVLLPMWTMMLVYGRAQTDEAPGNGGITLFLTIPLAAILVSVGIIPFWNLIYRKLS